MLTLKFKLSILLAALDQIPKWRHKLWKKRVCIFWYVVRRLCCQCKMALEDVPGVKHAAVDLEQCMAVVEYEAPATVEQLEMAVKEAGFTVEK